MSEPQELEFERIYTDGVNDRAVVRNLTCSRAKIPGGWIVLLTSLAVNPANEHLHNGFFVPDPAHVWDGRSLP